MSLRHNSEGMGALIAVLMFFGIFLAVWTAAFVAIGYYLPPLLASLVTLVLLAANIFLFVRHLRKNPSKRRHYRTLVLQTVLAVIGCLAGANI